MLFTNLRKRKLFTKSYKIYCWFSRADRAERAERAPFQPCAFSPGRAWRSLQPFTFQMSKTICNTKFIVYLQGEIGQKGYLFSPVFFPWACVGISRVSRARRLRKQATIKFDQWFIYKLISLHDLHEKSPRAPRGKNTGLKRCPFCPICPWKSTINFVLQIVLLIWKVKGCKDCEKNRFCK